MTIGWVGPGIRQFGTIACLLILTSKFNLINLGEMLSLILLEWNGKYQPNNVMLRTIT